MCLATLCLHLSNPTPVSCYFMTPINTYFMCVPLPLALSAGSSHYYQLLGHNMKDKPAD